MRYRVFAFLALFIAPQAAGADCVDINADAIDRLELIMHINPQRAQIMVEMRPWPSVGSIIAIHGIGPARIADILQENIACVGVRAPPGERERMFGTATVIDGDTLKVDTFRVRLIGIDAPEKNLQCEADGRQWACGREAATAVDNIVGNAHVECEIYGKDRYRRYLAVYFSSGLNINAEIVRLGWALAW